MRLKVDQFPKITHLKADQENNEGKVGGYLEEALHVYFSDFDEFHNIQKTGNLLFSILNTPNSFFTNILTTVTPL